MPRVFLDETTKKTNSDESVNDRNNMSLHG